MAFEMVLVISHVVDIWNHIPGNGRTVSVYVKIMILHTYSCWKFGLLLSFYQASFEISDNICWKIVD